MVFLQLFQAVKVLRWYISGHKGNHFQDDFVVSEHSADFFPPLLFGEVLASVIAPERYLSTTFSNCFTEVVDIVWWLSEAVHFDDSSSRVDLFE